MSIWAAALFLIVFTIAAITVVITTGLALKDAVSQDRASILRALAELVRALCGRS